MAFLREKPGSPLEAAVLRHGVSQSLVTWVAHGPHLATTPKFGKPACEGWPRRTAGRPDGRAWTPGPGRRSQPTTTGGVEQSHWEGVQRPPPVDRENADDTDRSIDTRRIHLDPNGTATTHPRSGPTRSDWAVLGRGPRGWLVLML